MVFVSRIVDEYQAPVVSKQSNVTPGFSSSLHSIPVVFAPFGAISSEFILIVLERTLNWERKDVTYQISSNHAQK
jgi:hypothetical protein